MVRRPVAPSTAPSNDPATSRTAEVSRSPARCASTLLATKPPHSASPAAGAHTSRPKPARGRLARGRSPTAPKRLTGRSQRAANPRDSRRPVGPGSGGVRRPSPSTGLWRPVGPGSGGVRRPSPSTVRSVQRSGLFHRPVGTPFAGCMRARLTVTTCGKERRPFARIGSLIPPEGRPYQWLQPQPALRWPPR